MIDVAVIAVADIVDIVAAPVILAVLVTTNVEAPTLFDAVTSKLELLPTALKLPLKLILPILAVPVADSVVVEILPAVLILPALALPTMVAVPDAEKLAPVISPAALINPLAKKLAPLMSPSE